ncbi:MAG TPA: glycosyltransferase [Blastocatellia bacterium]|nr:glycosyltransferase [Blastocatellia bacterium]
MRGTLGWRLLSVYGLVKHKLLKPAYRFVFSGGQRREGPIVAPPKVTEAEQAGPGPNAVEEVTTSLDSAEPARETPATVAPLATCPAIVPLNQIQPGRERGTWEALDMDPQFLLEPPYPSGWVRMAVHVDAPNSYRDHAWLYVDTGAGYSQEASYDLGEVNLPQSTYMYFDQGIVALRLDPLEGPDVFTITVELHPATADEAQRVLQPERPSTVEPGPGFKIPPRIDPYDSWLEINQWSSRREAVLREQLEELDDLPTISVVMPVYDPPPEFLNLAIQSVVDQVYDRWELCIADDASRDRRIRLLLEQWASRDSRIKLAFRELNGGISEASNRAAELATGEYLLLIDNDDALAHDALAEAALYFSHRPDTDVLYGDEDKVDAKGRRYDPAFKPDWSPELFLSYNYLNHPLFLRRSLFWQAGGFRTQMNLAQDWDLGLRVTEAARHVGHIPKVLYHWRAIPSSVAYSGESKPKGMLAARDVLADAFRRRGIQAEVFQPDWAVAGALALYGHRFADNGPSVSILIPTKNNVAILRACIDSLARTTYANYEIVVIDDGSDDPKTLEYLAQIPHRVLRIPSPNGAFSFADINNQAVEQVSSDYVLFLNDDTEVIAPEWLSQMVGYLGIPGVGAVGARLLYPNGRVQHAGVIHASHLPGPWHAFRYGSARDPGFMWWSMSTRNCSAVTAACMLTPRNLFMEIGGFDAEAFPVAYNDVDYCYRLLGSGRRIVFSATSELIHHESISRGPDGDPAELARIFTKYRDFTDKYYSPYLRDIGPVALAPRILTGPLKRPPRTLVCTHNLNFEGAPLVQMEITLGLRDRGVIDPVVHSPEDGPLRAEYESWGVPVEIRPHPLESVARTNEGYKIGMEVFTRWVQGIDVDLVYGNTLRTFYAIDAARMAGLPSIWNPRESEDWRSYFDEFGPEIAARALECFAYPYKVVFVSQASENGFAELCSRWNFMTIHDGMDKAKFGSAFRTTSRSAARRKLGVADHEVVVVTVGTVGPRKGQVDIPRAIALMDYQTVSSMRWYVVGDRNYDYSGTVRERQSSLDEARASRMEIVPETPDVLTYYSAADVFVCTSRIESFPRVILEAMAAGLPIVTTPVFGILEQVRPGRNALLYDPGDVQALAAAVTRMVNEPGLRQRMGAASLPALETLIDQDAMVTAYADVFREAWLSGAPRGKRRPKEEAASPVSQTGGGRGRAFAR